MLTTCPECNGKVSDRAAACPHCGCPMPTPRTRTAPRQQKRHVRLPNGYGSIKHLSGNRRNPYAAYPPTKEFTLDGIPVAVPAIGYFPSYNKAYEALAEYHRKGIPVAVARMTFAEVYELFWKTEIEGRGASKSKEAGYRSAYKKCGRLHGMEFAAIRKPDLQGVFDDCQSFSASTTANIRKLFNQMYKVAIENDIVSRNYAQNVVAGGVPVEKGVPFTEDELRVLWENRGDSAVQPALIMVYTGYRIGELEVATAHLGEWYFEGGLKTESGKGRVVPIHPAIRDIVASFDWDAYRAQAYRSRLFLPAMERLGMAKAASGERHTPHDCRHTFSWLADHYKMNSLAKHMIMGHSLGRDVEDAVYGHRTLEELRVEMEKIEVPF